MSRLLSMLAVAALSAAAAQPAAAAPSSADHDAAWLGVQQQGKGQGDGQGGGQEARGGRGQGGGQEARESRGRGRSGGSEARQSGQDREKGQSARGSSQGGQGSGSSARGSGGAANNRGSGNAEERGKGSTSAGAARSERGNSGGNAGSARSEERSSNASATATERRNANATASASGRGRSGPRDLQARIDALPAAQRRMATSARAGERMVAGAIARGHARGLRADAFDVRSDNGRVRIQNRRGDVLFDLDDRRAGELGGWPLRRLGDQSPRPNAPAFCRSGQGHPVWGREWCIDKGFGLGSRQGTVWSRGGIGDVIFRNPDHRTRLDRGGLIGVLGDIVLGRLALQSVALGYDEPLTGYWVADPSGPYILRVRSGDNEVAEFYDADRNNRVDVLYVVQPVW